MDIVSREHGGVGTGHIHTQSAPDVQHGIGRCPGPLGYLLRREAFGSGEHQVGPEAHQSGRVSAGDLLRRGPERQEKLGQLRGGDTGRVGGLGRGLILHGTSLTPSVDAMWA